MIMRVFIQDQHCPGDTLEITAAVRDLCVSHPDIRVNVRTTAQELWDNNPHLDKSVTRLDNDMSRQRASDHGHLGEKRTYHRRPERPSDRVRMVSMRRHDMRRHHRAADRRLRTDGGVLPPSDGIPLFADGSISGSHPVHLPLDRLDIRFRSPDLRLPSQISGLRLRKGNSGDGGVRGASRHHRPVRICFPAEQLRLRRRMRRADRHADRAGGRQRMDAARGGSHGSTQLHAELMLPFP